MPNSTRRISIDQKPVASAVMPQNSDHMPTAMPSTIFGPKRSVATPPTKLNSA